MAMSYVVTLRRLLFWPPFALCTHKWFNLGPTPTHSIIPQWAKQGDCKVGLWGVGLAFVLVGVVGWCWVLVLITLGLRGGVGLVS